MRNLAIVCACLFVVYFWVTRNDKQASSTIANAERASTLGVDVPESEMARPNPSHASAVAPTPYVPDETEAWVMAQDFVKRALKSPSTADFGGVFEDHQDPNCHALGDASWRCIGWVDAQNSFGAKIRSNFGITIKYKGSGEWADPQSWIVVAGPTVTAR